MIIHIIAFILVGLCSGLLAGLLGIGGGIIIVPTLYFIYSLIDIGITEPMHLAIGTSVAIIALSSIVSMFLYEKRQAVFWPIFKYLNIPLIIGSFIGVATSYILSGKVLSRSFAVIAVLFGLYFLFIKKVHKTDKRVKKSLLFFLGLCIGFLATLLGIGGGVIAIPMFIMLMRIPNYSLIGTASTATFITSIIGTLCYLIMGFNMISNDYSIGYIHIPSFLSIGIISLFSVPLGIKLADKLNVKILKKIFAVALIATGIFMFFK